MPAVVGSLERFESDDIESDEGRRPVNSVRSTLDEVLSAAAATLMTDAPILIDESLTVDFRLETPSIVR